MLVTKQLWWLFSSVLSTLKFSQCLLLCFTKETIWECGKIMTELKFSEFQLILFWVFICLFVSLDNSRESHKVTSSGTWQKEIPCSFRPHRWRLLFYICSWIASVGLQRKSTQLMIFHKHCIILCWDIKAFSNSKLLYSCHHLKKEMKPFRKR